MCVGVGSTDSTPSMSSEGCHGIRPAMLGADAADCNRDRPDCRARGDRRTAPTSAVAAAQPPRASQPSISSRRRGDPAAADAHRDARPSGRQRGHLRPRGWRSGRRPRVTAPASASAVGAARRHRRAIDVAVQQAGDERERGDPGVAQSRMSSATSAPATPKVSVVSSRQRAVGRPARAERAADEPRQRQREQRAARRRAPRWPGEQRERDHDQQVRRRHHDVRDAVVERTEARSRRGARAPAPQASAASEPMHDAPTSARPSRHRPPQEEQPRERHAAAGRAHDLAPRASSGARRRAGCRPRAAGPWRRRSRGCRAARSCLRAVRGRARGRGRSRRTRRSTAASHSGGRTSASTIAPSTIAEIAMPTSTPGSGTPSRPISPPNAITSGNATGSTQIAGAPKHRAPQADRDHRQHVVEARDRMREPREEARPPAPLSSCASAARGAIASASSAARTAIRWTDLPQVVMRRPAAGSPRAGSSRTRRACRPGSRAAARRSAASGSAAAGTRVRAAGSATRTRAARSRRRR